tara:strand:+ start:9271 stop:14052 length:4782 start_codon:yes stop_codon:yes gene_type:complete
MRNKIIAFISLFFISFQALSQCASNEVEISVVITTDNYPSETSWSLTDQNGGGWFINPGGLTQSNTTYTYTYCVPDTNCYVFTISDTWGDGICCGYGNGSYSVLVDGITVATGGSFQSSETTYNIGGCQLPPSSCAANEQEFFISITTDNYPLETSWQLVDQNGGGWFISPGDLTQSNTTYTWSICVPDTNCYTFTILDTYGDGICCGWGSGSYFVNYGGSQIASGGSFLSSETTSSIGSCSSSNCAIGETEIIITINTDDYPTETSWFLMDQYGGGWTNVPLTSSDANSILTWSLCVPDTNCYTFTILDSYGDGICCGWGNGSYNVDYNGVNVANGSSFTFAQEHCGIGSCNPMCQISIPSNAISEGESCGSDVNNGCDDNFKLSNFTITGIEDPWSFGASITYVGWPINGYVNIGPDFSPDFYIYMQENNVFYHYTDYYLDTWCPNSYGQTPAQPLSYSMFANPSITNPLELKSNSIFTTPSTTGLTYTYDFGVYDDDDGTFSLLGADDFIGSYVIPTPYVAGTYSITTSGGPDGNAYVNYTIDPPVSNYTPLSNNTVVHGTFFAENNYRDTDWYEIILSDSSDLTLHSISEVPYYIYLLDGNSGCGTQNILDSDFITQCDSFSLQQTIPPGTYWLLVTPSAYSCLPCSDSADYLLDISWSINCSMSANANIVPANCVSSNGNINLNINGGVGPYSFDWSDGSYSQDLTNVSVGTYSVIVTDSNLCKDTLTNLQVVDYASPLSISSVVVPESMANAFDGSIDITINGGVFPLSYNWSGPNLFTSNIQDVFGLESGFYIVEVIDVNGCTAIDTIEIEEFSIDVGVSSIISPSNSCVLDSAEQVVVMITNFNVIDASNFVVSFDWNGQVYTDSVFTNVPPGDSIIYTFSNTVNVSSGGVYTLNAFTSHSLDLNIGNDTASSVFTNYLHDFYSSDYEMGFEPFHDFSGWKIEDANNDSYTWNINQYTGFNQSYGVFYNYNFNGTTSADDWLISQCFELESNKTYTLGFKYRVASAAYPEQMNVCIGTSQQASSLTNVLLQMNNIINISYDSTFVSFSVPSDGIYYIGWHAISPANMWRIDLDDINISMILPNIYGCTDSVAINFDPNANTDDGSCLYCVYGCMDSTAFNYDSSATCPDLSCVSIMYGCTDPLALNYYLGANVDDGSCIYSIYGCTDSNAINYDPTVLIDDGSCIYPLLGCTDSTAYNFDSLANTDDGSCQPYIYGCTDSLALNYYAAANSDDSSCLYYIYGCTDPVSCNYNPLANMDDGSCFGVVGCIDSTALNYNPSACIDDGSCQYPINCGEVTGIYVSNIIHDRATFNWNNMNNSNCQVDQIRIRYRSLGSSSWQTKTMGVPVGSGCNTSNISKTVLNLTPSTLYEYEFKIWYCNSGVVNWHALDTFSTKDSCVNMINVSVNSLSSTKVEVCWDSVYSYSFVRFKYRIDSVGSTYYNIGGSGVFSPLLCKQKNGLVPNTSYRLIYRTWCNSMGGAYRSPAWDGPVFFSTPSNIRESNNNINKIFDLFPNPSRGKFTISIDDQLSENSSLNIYNLLGELVLEIDLHHDQFVYNVDLSNYSKGIYTVVFKSELDQYHEKIIVQ